jgi:hypothetical protein
MGTSLRNLQQVTHAMERRYEIRVLSASSRHILEVLLDLNGILDNMQALKTSKWYQSISVHWKNIKTHPMTNYQQAVHILYISFDQSRFDQIVFKLSCREASPRWGHSAPGFGAVEM